MGEMKVPKDDDEEVELSNEEVIDERNQSEYAVLNSTKEGYDKRFECFGDADAYIQTDTVISLDDRE